MVMRSLHDHIHTVPSSVANRNLSLANLTKLFKDVCLDVRKKTAVSIFEFSRKRRNIRKGKKTERPSSSSLFETLYPSHHFLAMIVN